MEMQSESAQRLPTTRESRRLRREINLSDSASACSFPKESADPNRTRHLHAPFRRRAPIRSGTGAGAPANLILQRLRSHRTTVKFAAQENDVCESGLR